MKPQRETSLVAPEYPGMIPVTGAATIQLFIGTAMRQYVAMHLPTLTGLSRRAFIASLLACAVFVHSVQPLAAERPSGSARFENEISAFETADKTNPPPKRAILFIGSSSIRLWKTLPQDFPGHKVINRGFGGSEIADSVYFADRIVFPYEPRMIVLYAGGNDINGGKSPEVVSADFKAFVEKVRAKLPDTRIAYISIAPNPARWSQVERVKAANKLISVKPCDISLAALSGQKGER